jgi:hypothetical protein
MESSKRPWKSSVGVGVPKARATLAIAGRRNHFWSNLQRKVDASTYPIRGQSLAETVNTYIYHGSYEVKHATASRTP